MIYIFFVGIRKTVLRWIFVLKSILKYLLDKILLTFLVVIDFDTFSNDNSGVGETRL